jgi:hypothetical protein
MHRFGKGTLALAMLALGMTAVWAQERRPGGPDLARGRLILLGSKDVQKDLKLTDDQVKKFEEFEGKQKTAGRGTGQNEELHREAEAFIKDVLKP